MEKPEKNLYFKLLTPLLLAATLMTYSIGVGLAHHVGADLDLTNVVLGSLLGVFLILMRNYLAAYFDHPDFLNSVLHKDDPKFEMLKRMNRQRLLQISLVILSAGAMVTVLLITRGALSTAGLVFLGLAFLICFFSATPPLKLNQSGYGEVLEAILISNLLPGLAFLLQGEEPQVLMVMVTLPITFTYLAMKIALSFENYAFEITRYKKTLVVRLGWQKAMQLHNLLILTSFLLVGIFAVMGLSWSLVWPLLLPIPLGIFEIFQMQQISDGLKPKWRLLKWTAIGLFATMAYLANLALWMR